MIRILDNNTINKIAAGEVVERPASIVKELIENSIDAKATKITIEIRNGGKSYIRITDNGIGIEKNEIETAFLSHATSKIQGIDDLQGLITFGFRGEALPSISSVSKISIETKIEDCEYGYKYNINYGDKGELKEAAINNGTTIIVENLFENVPVRKNFLLNDQSESSKIFDIIQKEALANPSISFKFIQDNKERLHTAGDNTLKNIIYTIYGKECVNNLIEIDSHNDITLKGFISNPSFVRNNRNDEIYFVNNRYVKNPIIGRAIEEAYKPYLMQHKFPFVVLFLMIEPNVVDVNVHPQKAEVRFANNNHIYGIVYNAVREALQKFNPVGNLIDNNFVKLNEAVRTSSNTFSGDAYANEKDVKTYNNLQQQSMLNEKFTAELKNASCNIDYKQINNSNTNKDNIFSTNKQIDNNIGISNSTDNDIPIATVQNDTLIQNTNYSFLEKENKNYKIIGQLFNTYVLVEYENSLYIIDQHAAHEKIYFERFMKKINSSFEEGLIKQKVFPEIILSLNQTQINTINIYNDILLHLGFTFEIFGENDVRISTIPFDIPNISKKELLMEFVDDLSDLKGINDTNIIKEKIAQMSCKKAVKANHYLNNLELENLLKDLFALDNPFHCPHGRPIIYKITHEELDKKFKRIL